MVFFCYDRVRRKEGIAITNQHRAPLWEAMKRYKQNEKGSYHVPGHKNGKILPAEAKETFSSILRIDATEVGDLDDLHSPAGVILEAEELAKEHFGSGETHFLINGSTSGNLSMILAVCRRGSRVLVQRNAHKSVMHALELAGVIPVFLSPEWEDSTKRHSALTLRRIQEGFAQCPDAEALILTYPDYFGRTYDLEPIISLAHQKGVPVLVDEAHGVHFSLHENFPRSAISLGADVVVQSAHKMAPAMTMGAYIHSQGKRIKSERLRHMLQVFQSSSPSYPIMASLDLARSYLAQWEDEGLFPFLKHVREELRRMTEEWEVAEPGNLDDPLKVILRPGQVPGFTLASELEKRGVHPEMATDREVVLTFGLEVSDTWEKDKEAFKEAGRSLQNNKKHAKISGKDHAFPALQQLEVSYEKMDTLLQRKVPIAEAEGAIAAEAVTPYPPGIPIVLRGERIRREQIETLRHLLHQGARFQNENIEKELPIFEEEWS